jgi:hypothetical protein
MNVGAHDCIELAWRLESGDTETDIAEGEEKLAAKLLSSRSAEDDGLRPTSTAPGP